MPSTAHLSQSENVPETALTPEGDGHLDTTKSFLGVSNIYITFSHLAYQFAAFHHVLQVKNKGSSIQILHRYTIA